MEQSSGLENVLVIGGGGREHALTWKISQSRHVGKIFVAPGNAGTSSMWENVSLDINDHRSISDFVRNHNIKLTVSGPEKPLVTGLYNHFEDIGLISEGYLFFGPSLGAARLEGSKVFSKQFMRRCNIPTADFVVCDNPGYALDEASKFLKEDGRAVMKADGLAEGKGAIVCSNYDQIKEAVDVIMVKKKFGESGNNVVVERFMPGEEASILVLTDGKNIRYLASSQDHKAVYDGDKGPNTGGMGAYAPAPVVTFEVMLKVNRLIVEPTITHMAGEGNPFRGCLYVGLMIDKRGNPRVVEYNVRFGDPETQPVLSLLESDLYVLLKACANGTLDHHKIVNREGAACCVVMASGGYPNSYEKGKIISGLEEADKIPGVNVFHAGTACKDGKIITSGGRVLGVNGVGPTIRDAINTAYAGVKPISWEGEYHRSDIGHRALERQ
jgi:phosphoribosylamine--glycine ligase